jgi:hypothetical protein
MQCSLYHRNRKVLNWLMMLTLCIDVLMTLCWCVDVLISRCVDVLMWWRYWSVDVMCYVLMTCVDVLTCWYVGVLMILLMTLVMVWCAEFMMYKYCLLMWTCWWHSVGMLRNWCVKNCVEVDIYDETRWCVDVDYCYVDNLCWCVICSVFRKFLRVYRFEHLKCPPNCWDLVYCSGMQFKSSQEHRVWFCRFWKTCRKSEKWEEKNRIRSNAMQFVGLKLVDVDIVYWCIDVLMAWCVD